MSFKKDPIIYIGYDEREQVAFDMCVASIRENASKPINIIPLRENSLRRAGLYRRSHWQVDNQKYDNFDGRPFSTSFSFTRFLVPHLNQYEGLALFMDCDMFVRSDIWKVFEKCEEPYSGLNDDYAVYCVHHDYMPNKGKKMDNQIQEPYNRKNWSSFMVFDCGHEGNKRFTVDDVNTKEGRWLHNFKWLNDYEIGYIPSEWNWLDGFSNEHPEPANVHFTTGGPWFDEWKPSRDVDKKYADEWTTFAKAQTQHQQIITGSN